MKMLLNILCQLYLNLWNFVRKSECTPCLTFFNYSTLQKDKNIVRRHSHIAQVQTDRVTHIYNIYIYMYTFILFSIINNNVALFTSKSKEEEEVYIFYKTGEENNIFKCWKKLGKLSSSIYVSCAAMERSNILIFIWLPRHLYAVVKYNKGRVSLCSHQAVKISC